VVIRFGDAADMPFEDCLFEGVYAIETAFHYPDKDAFARESYRVLRPGGGLAVADVVWKYTRIPFIHGARTWLWRTLMASPQIFTADQWRQSLAAAGFSDIRVEDISRQTLEMVPLWIERVRKHRDELAALFTGWGVDLATFFFARRFRRLPLRYVLVTGKKA
jgi:ubiquinone/menaquinone biosynthesis C-methylase UbiE